MSLVAVLAFTLTAHAQTVGLTLPASPIAGAAPGAAPRAVVTGASSGLGQALAVELGKQGWNVAIVGRRVDLLQKTARMVELAGGTALALTGDVTDPNSVRENYAAIKDRWG
ncbi:MAG: SDR family NAD(P)-dependent oxidoreductase, partial [Elusimicrobia bacterium]|nr:SDR family NAD(P)-dependent oxidoreductase [Elusimicrobiota bacterium]